MNKKQKGMGWAVMGGISLLGAVFLPGPVFQLAAYVAIVCAVMAYLCWFTSESGEPARARVRAHSAREEEGEQPSGQGQGRVDALGPARRAMIRILRADADGWRGAVLATAAGQWDLPKAVPGEFGVPFPPLQRMTPAQRPCDWSEPEAVVSQEATQAANLLLAGGWSLDAAPGVESISETLNLVVLGDECMEAAQARAIWDELNAGVPAAQVLAPDGAAIAPESTQEAVEMPKEWQEDLSLLPWLHREASDRHMRLRLYDYGNRAMVDVMVGPNIKVSADWVPTRQDSRPGPVMVPRTAEYHRERVKLLATDLAVEVHLMALASGANR